MKRFFWYFINFFGIMKHTNNGGGYNNTLTGGLRMKHCNGNNIPVIIDSICFILSKINKADKIHLIKLVYLADKYHLMNYGRTITNDNYMALSHGPVGSITMDVLEYDPYVLGEYLDISQSMFVNTHDFEYSLSDQFKIEMLENLSESDIEALEFSINNFGNMNKWDVVHYTHTLPEWKQYKNHFDQNKIKRADLKTEEVSSTPKDRYFNVPEDHIAQSIEILNGTFD